MKKVAKRKARKKATKSAERNDYCETCGVCDAPDWDQHIPMSLCKNCQKTVCPECQDANGRCGFCAEYEFGDNVKVVTAESDASGSYNIGGHLKDMPKPHKRWFDDKPMVVEVRIVKFYGIGIHYWTSVKEHYNAIWDGKHWTSPWDDEHKYMCPFSTERKCLTPKTATAFVKSTLKKRYKKQPILLKFETSEHRCWFYKEGD